MFSVYSNICFIADSFLVAKRRSSRLERRRKRSLPQHLCWGQAPAGVTYSVSSRSTWLAALDELRSAPGS